MAATGQPSEVELQTEQDVVRARQAVRKITQELKFGLVDQTKLVTAASELARNAVIHGRGGKMEVEVLPTSRGSESACDSSIRVREFPTFSSP
jgi:serine/threonine-protein kinase RsbT